MPEYYFKLTKKCNLRCTYCYEQESFGDPTMLSLSDMENAFHKIKNYSQKMKEKHIYLGFTGGEVLTLGKEYLESLLKLSKRIFRGSGIDISHRIQTNLTLVDKDYIDIFKKYNVSIGTSFDVVGGQRKFVSGKKIDRDMIEKMILMLENRVFFGVIVVITKRNFRNPDEIYHFFKDIYTGFSTNRLVPCSDKICPDIVINDDEYIRFLRNLTDIHLKQKKPVPVPNIDDYVALLTKGPGHAYHCFFAKNCAGNKILFIEPNGDVYPCCNLRYRDFYLGNILEDKIEKIKNSSVLKYLEMRENNIDRECEECKYLKLCNGGCMMFAYHEGNIMGKSKSHCKINRSMFEYIEKKLIEKGKSLY